jgi:hypothetical protein
MFDFLSAPVDFQTAYFVVFGGILLYGVILVLLDWLGQRQQRRAQKQVK